MDEKRYWREVKSIEKKYYDLISEFNTNFPKCLNLNSEKKKFFKALADDKVYNPQFKFESKEFDKDKFEELKKLKIDTSNDLYNLKKLLKERKKNKIQEIEGHIRWGHPSSTKYVNKYRGKPPYLLLRKAKKFCIEYQRQKVRFKTISPMAAGRRLQEEVKKLTGEKISFTFSNELPSKMAISPQQQVININPSYRFTSLEIKRLKVHEIGVHYMRYFNGKKLGVTLLQSGTSNYVETEEGLAVYMEDYKGVSSMAQKFIYAGRVIGTYYALKKSFYEVYCILREYGFKEDDAFAITARAKRNLKDTSEKGGFTKDYLYFSGYLKVKKFAKKNDLKYLFAGKIKVEDVGKLKPFLNKHMSKVKTPLDKEQTTSQE